MAGRKRWTILGILLMVFVLILAGCGGSGKAGGRSSGQSEGNASDESSGKNSWYGEEDEEKGETRDFSDVYEDQLDENGSYTSKEDVMNYLIQYNRLPDNFITKKEARSLGWSGGSLEEYAPGKCIGGDRFGNYEELLPVVRGRQYYECDIDTLGAKSRGAKRIVYSDDGQIYFTQDHYESFELLYGEDEQ